MPPPNGNERAPACDDRGSAQSDNLALHTAANASPAQARSVLVETPLARWWQARHRERLKRRHRRVNVRVRPGRPT